MNLLLDTHTLIWLAEADNNLSQPAKSAIENPENTCFVSVATFWEMAIKTSIGKLEMQMPLTQLKHLITENGIEILPINIEHTVLIRLIHQRADGMISAYANGYPSTRRPPVSAFSSRVPTALSGQ